MEGLATKEPDVVMLTKIDKTCKRRWKGVTNRFSLPPQQLLTADEQENSSLGISVSHISRLCVAKSLRLETMLMVMTNKGKTGQSVRQLNSAPGNQSDLKKQELPDV